jgi:cytochrome P450
VKTVSLASLHTEAGRRDPYPFYARLHERGPICPVAPGERYSFVVHGFEASSQVLKDSATFRVAESSTPGSPAHTVFMNSMFFTNAPRHTRMRRMFNQAFTPRRVHALLPSIERMTGELLDGLSGRDRVDFMAEFAFRLPANVLGELLGVPEDDRSWYRPRALALGALLELGASSQETQHAADAAAREITPYFAELAAKRRAQPRDDLVSALVQALEADGDVLSEEELTANLIVLFNAGFVTTTHLLGNGLTLLMEHREHFARLREHPELAPSYVEEILRFELPTHFSVRWAAADTEVAGVRIAESSWVLVLLAAANRDPARFAEPDRFDPSRFNAGKPDLTLSFGAGAHYCLGAALARLEGVSGLRAVVERFPAIRLAEPAGVPRQLMLRGHEQLWVTTRAARR